MFWRRLWLVALAVGVSYASEAGGDRRLERLFRTFIAPCCWRENLLVHHSPKGDELRAEIRQLVAAGKSDDEIKDVLVKQYSVRILSLPDGARGQWLFWTPFAAVMAGLFVVGFVIRRLRKQAPAVATNVSGPLPDLDDEWDNR